jgi:two-component system chemotaxis response regulator CheB
MVSLETPKTGRDILLIGASAGGVHALCEVVAQLPRDLPAAVFVVLHLAPSVRSALPAILSRCGSLPADHPQDGDPIVAGRIYIAPPDRHMMLEPGRVRLSLGPTENGHRPAVDVLFRTAARTCGPRAVGVVLTGNLDDGTAGLAQIKRCGGVAMVQDPDEADYPGMPTSAIANVDVDHILSIAEMGPRLEQLAREPIPESVTGAAPMNAAPDPNEEGGANQGEPSAFTCPDCGGTLFEKPGEKILHFRCRTGHAYSPETLLDLQSNTLEGALWAALRSLEENAALSRRMARRMNGNAGSARRRYEERALAADGHAALLRELLDHGQLQVR